MNGYKILKVSLQYLGGKKEEAFFPPHIVQPQLYERGSEAILE